VTWRFVSIRLLKHICILNFLVFAIELSGVVAIELPDASVVAQSKSETAHRILPAAGVQLFIIPFTKRTPFAALRSMVSNPCGIPNFAAIFYFAEAAVLVTRLVQGRASRTNGSFGTNAVPATLPTPPTQVQSCKIA
jgi:hypothetical protein